jgi:hypothetical protein
MARKSVSRWEEIVEESKKGMKIWMGIDVHKESYTMAILSEHGVSHHFRTPSDNLGLLKQFQERGIQIKSLNA